MGSEPYNNEITWADDFSYYVQPNTSIKHIQIIWGKNGLLSYHSNELCAPNICFCLKVII